jgi:hypothetical protein
VKPFIRGVGQGVVLGFVLCGALAVILAALIFTGRAL